MDEMTMDDVTGESARHQPAVPTEESHQQADEHESKYNDDTSTVYKYSSRSTIAQVVATLIQNWLLFSVGMEIGMSTLVIGALHKHPEEKLCMDNDQASWYASLPPLVRPIGSMTSGILQEYLGRKRNAALVNIPLFVAWLTIYFADSVHALYASAVIMGLSCGLYEAPVHSYIGEIAEPRLRGILSTSLMCCVTSGIIFSFIIGNFIEWRDVALIGSAIPLIAFVFMSQIPESPTWLVRKNRLEDAQKSLSWLRGWVEPEKTQNEFRALVKYVKVNEQSKTTEANCDGRPVIEKKLGYLKTELKAVTEKKVWRPLRLVMLVLAINYTTTFNGMRPYWIRILDEFKLPFNSRSILIFSPIIFLVGTFSNVLFLRRVGKRRMALISNGLMIPIIVLLGIYSSFHSSLNQIPGFVWVPIILPWISDILCGFSVMPLPWQLVSEVFPPEGRGTASGLSSTWAHFVSFTLSKSFLYLRDWLNLSGVFYLYGAIAFLGWLHHYYFLPETEGKSLAQIESYFTKNHDKKEKFSIGKSI